MLQEDQKKGLIARFTAAFQNVFNAEKTAEENEQELKTWRDVEEIKIKEDKNLSPEEKKVATESLQDSYREAQEQLNSQREDEHVHKQGQTETLGEDNESSKSVESVKTENIKTEQSFREEDNTNVQQKLNQILNLGETPGNKVVNQQQHTLNDYGQDFDPKQTSQPEEKDNGKDYEVEKSLELNTGDEKYIKYINEKTPAGHESDNDSKVLLYEINKGKQFQQQQQTIRQEFSNLAATSGEHQISKRKESFVISDDDNRKDQNQVLEESSQVKLHNQKLIQNSEYPKLEDGQSSHDGKPGNIISNSSQEAGKEQSKYTNYEQSKYQKLTAIVKLPFAKAYGYLWPEKSEVNELILQQSDKSNLDRSDGKSVYAVDEENACLRNKLVSLQESGKASTYLIETLPIQERTFSNAWYYAKSSYNKVVAWYFDMQGKSSVPVEESLSHISIKNHVGQEVLTGIHAGISMMLALSAETKIQSVATLFHSFVYGSRKHLIDTDDFTTQAVIDVSSSFVSGFVYLGTWGGLFSAVITSTKYGLEYFGYEKAAIVLNQTQGLSTLYHVGFFNSKNILHTVRELLKDGAYTKLLIGATEVQKYIYNASDYHKSGGISEAEFLDFNSIRYDIDLREGEFQEVLKANPNDIGALKLHNCRLESEVSQLKSKNDEMELSLDKLKSDQDDLIAIVLELQNDSIDG